MFGYESDALVVLSGLTLTQPYRAPACRREPRSGFQSTSLGLDVTESSK